MSDTLRSKMIRLAASWPKGSTERRELLDVLASSTADENEVLASSMAREDGKVPVLDKNNNKRWVDPKDASKYRKYVPPGSNKDDDLPYWKRIPKKK